MSSQSSTRYLPITTNMDNPTLSGSSGDLAADRNCVEAGLPATCSSQQLMPPLSDTDSVQPPANGITKSQWFTLAILCFINLINYMDRYTIAGVLTEVQEDFDIGDDIGGLLQTVFVMSYMVFAPIFGYFGDRYSRRWIMMIGIFLWSASTILGSFMPTFVGFIIFRALVGIGEASYSTIAPTILSDLFVNDLRSKALALFYFAIPVGSGFGYIIGSETAHLAGGWRWSLRVTPILGAMACALIFFIEEPERGQSEGSQHLEPTTYKEDIKHLVKNRSFIFSTAGFTCVAFVAGALGWWGPKVIFYGLKTLPGNESMTPTNVSYKFGIIAMIAGLIGVPLGSLVAQRLRPRFENCDPYICAAGLLISAPMVFMALVTPQTTVTFCFIFVFLAQVSLNLCWSIVADMLLYVVMPTRRSTAEAIQILISHLLGDAGSPYFVGLLSEAIKRSIRANTTQTSKFDNTIFQGIPVNQMINDAPSASVSIRQSITQGRHNISEYFPMSSDFVWGMMQMNFHDTDETKFQALQYSLFSMSFVEVLGAVFFMLTAIYIVNDKRKATQETLGNSAN